MTVCKKWRSCKYIKNYCGTALNELCRSIMFN